MNEERRLGSSPIRHSRFFPCSPESPLLRSIDSKDGYLIKRRHDADCITSKRRLQRYIRSPATAGRPRSNREEHEVIGARPEKAAFEGSSLHLELP
jgi:hypothetical protein